MTISVEIINQLSNNYSYLISGNKDNSSIIIDPAESDKILKELKQKKLNLNYIFITHHHSDHTSGVADLIEAYPEVKVFSPSKLNSISVNVISDGNKITTNLNEFEIIHTPGHTLDHIAYYSKDIDSLFCGDTLFSGGCGRLFEGTPLQMFDSLNKFSNLPKETKVYCTHEYTLSNLTFALEVEPDNIDLRKYFEEVSSLRNSNLMSLPSSINLENRINPFLRTSVEQVKENAENYANKQNLQPVEILAAIRDWKDNF